MTDFIRPPNKEEVQYARDILQGKHRMDMSIMIGAAIVGAAFGIAVGLSANASDEGPFDFPLFLICIAACALCFFVITMLALASMRTIKAVCNAWLSGRVIVGVACALLLMQIAQKVWFWTLFPSSIVGDVVMGAIGLVFFLLLLTIGLRFVYFIYCAVTKKDDEDIVAAHIAAKEHPTPKKGDFLDDGNKR